MLLRKKNKSEPVVEARRRRGSSSGSGPRGDHWYEVVRSLRTFYDHFQVAFPHLERLPKHYSKEWAEQFKKVARDFVRTEDMHGVRKVLVGVGYGTEKWPEVVKQEAEDIARAVDILLEEVARQGVETEDGLAVDPAILNAKGVIGDEFWQAMLDMPELVIPVLKRHLSGEPEDQVVSVPGSANDQLAEKLAELEAELEAARKGFEASKKENHILAGQAEEKDQEIQILEGRVRRLEESGEEEDSEAQEEQTGHSGRLAELKAELESFKQKFEESKKENHALAGQVEEKDREIQVLEGKIRRTEEAEGEVAPELQTKQASEEPVSERQAELEAELETVQ